MFIIFQLYNMVVNETIVSYLERATVKLRWRNNPKKLKEYIIGFVIEKIGKINIIFSTAHFVKHVKWVVKHYGYKEINVMFYWEKSYTCQLEKLIINSEILILSCCIKSSYFVLFYFSLYYLRWLMINLCYLMWREAL